MNWFFVEMRRSDVNVDPIQGEFFSIEIIDGLAEALVREAVQNSLDAAASSKPVKVRFWLSDFNTGLEPDKSSTYFNGLTGHLRAKNSGLRTVPEFTNAIPYLLIEDFETKGLEGSVDQDKDIPGQRNDFYYFWRNVGRSGKQEKDRGRWGLGKNVFPASSRINSFFGLTIRQSTSDGLLMGQSVLKIHELHGKRSAPYGYFGTADHDEFALPVTDPGLVEQFKKDFQLARSQAPGLSIVVPFPDPDITWEAILKAAVRQYFYPILLGSLLISVGQGSKEIEIGKDTIISLVGALDPAFRKELQPLLELAQWSTTVQDLSLIEPKSPDKAPKWDEDSIGAEIIGHVRPKFESGEPVAFSSHLFVRQKNKQPQLSYFNVYLQRDLDMDSHRPVFIREGLIISDALKPKQRGVRSLVVINDKPLATMLGDAENPAHTEWQARSAHFKEKYEYGQSTLTYVKNSAGWISQLVASTKDEIDLNVLADVFFLAQPPTPEAKRKNERKKPKPGPKPPLPIPPDPPKIKKLRVSKITGGFSVQPAVPDLAADRVRISAAYEVRNGSALQRYHPADFELNKQPIDLKIDGVPIIQIAQNTLILGPVNSDFRALVTGFDPSRDLVVSVNVEGDDAQTL